ncbi:hypothetical protein Hanom_Chr15g01391671 [Helianthus anomalus]
MCVCYIVVNDGRVNHAGISEYSKLLLVMSLQRTKKKLSKRIESTKFRKFKPTYT